MFQLQASLFWVRCCGNFSLESDGYTALYR
jgi:hypothetical protein